MPKFDAAKEIASIQATIAEAPDKLATVAALILVEMRRQNQTLRQIARKLPKITPKPETTPKPELDPNGEAGILCVSYPAYLKIPVIKALRSLFNLDLKQAKDIIEGRLEIRVSHSEFARVRDYFAKDQRDGRGFAQPISGCRLWTSQTHNESCTT